MFCLILSAAGGSAEKWVILTSFLINNINAFKVFPFFNLKSYGHSISLSRFMALLPFVSEGINVNKFIYIVNHIFFIWYYIL
jgi:hypothetical protein